MIEIKNLSKYYNNDSVVTLGLRNINLKFQKNEIVAIIGDSGSGKSTLLNVICGVDTYDEGEMLFNGNETSYFNQNDLDEYRKQHVGFIYQNYNIIDSYTVLENVMLPMLINGVPQKEAKERATNLIQRVGLFERIHNKGTKLSGGEKQRCVIARALATDCEILACDEPTGNLDSKTGAEIIQLIQEVAKDKLVLIVTHNYDEVKDIITRRIKISDGEVVEDYQMNSVEEDSSLQEESHPSKFKKSYLFLLALKNIKSTPKKTFFSFFVFLCLSMIAFFLYLTCIQSAETSTYNPDDYFQIYSYNRLIAFNYDHTPIEKGKIAKIKDKYYENAFYEDCEFEATFVRNNSRRPVNLVYSQHEISYEHILGEQPVKDEVYIIFPKQKIDEYSLEYSNFIGGTLRVNSYFENKFVGFGSSAYVNMPVLVSKMGDEFTEKICKLVYRQDVSMQVRVPELEKNFKANFINQRVSTPTLYLPKELQGYEDFLELEMIMKNIYSAKLPTFTYSFVDYAKTECYFSLPYEYLIEADDVYELTVYAQKPKECTKSLESLGLTVLRPSIGYDDFSVNLLLLYIYVIISLIVIFVLSFICYAILSRIYISKNKEYTVFRSLGIMNKQMNWIVLLEMVILALLASVVAFIAMYVIYFTTHWSFLNIVTYNTFGITLLYYVTIFLFTVLIARRFNRRLFKLSVQTSLKGDVARND